MIIQYGEPVKTGDMCNKCDGEMEITIPENCTCHCHSPCPSCRDMEPICNKCGCEEGE